MEGAIEAIRRGAIPGGLVSNREFAECMVAVAEGSDIVEDLRKLMYDPQTSGGLLISVAMEDANGLLKSLRSSGLPAARIGRVVASSPAGGNPAIILK